MSAPATETGLVIAGVTPDQARLWCNAGNHTLRERRERERELRRLWHTGDTRPEWCLLAREGQVPLGALRLLKEDPEGRTLVVDELSLPWQGAWRGLGRRLLTVAVETACRAGAHTLAWQFPRDTRPDPGPLALDQGFRLAGTRVRHTLELSAGQTPEEGWARGWQPGFADLVASLLPGQREAWREGGDLLLSAGRGPSTLLALGDGDGTAELLLPADGPAEELSAAARVLLAGLYRHGVRRLELEQEGPDLPGWLVALPGLSGPPAPCGGLVRYERNPGPGRD